MLACEPGGTTKSNGVLGVEGTILSASSKLLGT
jgi:hypothetical protein